MLSLNKDGSKTVCRVFDQGPPTKPGLGLGPRYVVLVVVDVRDVVVLEVVVPVAEIVEVVVVSV